MAESNHKTTWLHGRRWLLELLFLFAVERSVNKFSPSNLPYVWFAVLFLATLELLLLAPIQRRIKQLNSNFERKGRIVLYVSLFVVGGSLFCFYFWAANRFFRDQAESPLFSVEVRSASVSDSGPLTFYMVGYPSMFGLTASPVFYLVYFQVTNLQDVPATIKELKVAASKEPEGPYEDLVPIPLPVTTLYSLGVPSPHPKVIAMSNGTYRLATPMTMDDMRRVAILGVSPWLESELSKPILAHTPVRGWMAFDSLRRVGLTPGQIYFRVTIVDTANKGGKYVTPLPISSGITDTSLQGDNGSLHVTGIRTDISGFHVKYYGDPFPPVSTVSKSQDNPIVLRLADFINAAAAIQARFFSTNDVKQMNLEYAHWDAEVRNYFEKESGLNKAQKARFRKAEGQAIELPDHDPKGAAIWAAIDAKTLELSRIQSELRQRS